MCTLCAYYYFPKNNENCEFCKIVIFDQNQKCWKLGVSLFCWKQCVLHSKSIGCIAMYIEIHGGKHYIYVSFTQSLYFTFF